MLNKLTCEFCEKVTDEFGDVEGAIVCGDCLGWYGKPSPEVLAYLKSTLEDSLEG